MNDEGEDQSKESKAEEPKRFKDFNVDRIEASCAQVSSILRAMAHPQRLLVLSHLTLGEKNVTELQELCGISQSQLSQFLGRMKAEGLVQVRHESLYRYYSISDRRISELVIELEKLFCH